MYECIHIYTIKHTHTHCSCGHAFIPHFPTSTHFHTRTHFQTRLLLMHTYLRCSPFFPVKHKSLLPCNILLRSLNTFFLRKVFSAYSIPLPLCLSLSLFLSLSLSLSLSRYTAALGEVQTLKVKLQSLTQEEFKKDAMSIKRRLDLALRSRFVPESIVTSVALFGDVQVGNVCV